MTEVVNRSVHAYFERWSSKYVGVSLYLRVQAWTDWLTTSGNLTLPVHHRFCYIAVYDALVKDVQSIV